MKAQREHIRPISESSVHAFGVESDRYDNHWHYHPEMEITLILAGSGTRVVGDRASSFGPGSLCLLGGNIPHVFHSSEPMGGAGTARAEVLQFDPGPWRRLAESLPELREVRGMLERACLGLDFPVSMASGAARRLGTIRKTTAAKRVGAFLDLLNWLAAARGTRPICGPGFTERLHGLRSERIERACSHILEHFAEDLSHEEVARRAHMAPAAFSRLFRRVTGRTYTEFLSEIRLGHACRLLAETDMGVAEISYASGFGNLANFNRRFRARNGVTPTAYRKRLEGL